MGYYWKATNFSTGEISVKNREFRSIPRALRDAMSWVQRLWATSLSGFEDYAVISIHTHLDEYGEDMGEPVLQKEVPLRVPWADKLMARRLLESIGFDEDEAFDEVKEAWR